MLKLTVPYTLHFMNSIAGYNMSYVPLRVYPLYYTVHASVCLQWKQNSGSQFDIYPFQCNIVTSEIAITMTYNIYLFISPA